MRLIARREARGAGPGDDGPDEAARCRECGTLLPKNAHYCNECGTSADPVIVDPFHAEEPPMPSPSGGTSSRGVLWVLVATTVLSAAMLWAVAFTSDPTSDAPSADVAASPATDTTVATASASGSDQPQGSASAPVSPSTTVVPGPRSWNPILATTKAKVAPAAATCAASTDPTVQGPIDQQRPTPGWVGSLAAAYDRRTGRIVHVDSQQETWTFDVCENTWRRMNPTGKPIGELSAGLVYDVDSDVTVAFGYEHISVYDAETNAWTQPGNDTIGLVDSIVPTGAVYDPATGLILTTDNVSSGADAGSWDLWACDVETNTWTRIGAIPAKGLLDLLGYSQAIDRFILAGFLDQETKTVLLHPGTGETTLVATETPFVNLGWPNAVHGPADDSVYVYKHAGRLRLCSFNAASLTWTCIEPPGALLSAYAAFSAVVGDPINDRVVLMNGVSGNFWVAASDDVWVVDLASGEWTQILARSRLGST